MCDACDDLHVTSIHKSPTSSLFVLLWISTTCITISGWQSFYVVTLYLKSFCCTTVCFAARVIPRPSRFLPCCQGTCGTLIISSHLHSQVAATLLKRYKDKFSGNPLGATWGYLRQIARDALPPNPLVSHDTQPAHLRDSAFLIKTLR